MEKSVVLPFRIYITDGHNRHLAYSFTIRGFGVSSLELWPPGAVDPTIVYSGVEIDFNVSSDPENAVVEPWLKQNLEVLGKLGAAMAAGGINPLAMEEEE